MGSRIWRQKEGHFIVGLVLSKCQSYLLNSWKSTKHEHNIHQRKHWRSVAGTLSLDQSGTRHSRNPLDLQDSLGSIIKRKNLYISTEIAVLSFLTLTLTVVVWSSCDVLAGSSSTSCLLSGFRSVPVHCGVFWRIFFLDWLKTKMSKCQSQPVLPKARKKFLHFL